MVVPKSEITAENTSKKGNFDLFGTPEDITQAQAAIAPFLQTARK